MNRRHFLGVAGTGLGAAALAPAHAQGTRPQKLVGLSIGINDYSSLKPLRTAHQDAMAVSQRLSGAGYDIPPPSDRQGVVDILMQFENFLTRLDRTSAAFLFLAGHGLQVGGTNYFLPSDTPKLASEEDLKGALQLDYMLESIAMRRPAQTIVVLDCCRNAPVSGELAGYNPGLASSIAPRGFFVAYSAGSGEYALDRLDDGDASPNGVFTRHLLDHLQPERSIYDIISATRASVIRDAQSVGHAQHPAIYDQSPRPYWLDGQYRLGGAQGLTPVGTMARQGFVIVATDDYRGIASPIKSPRGDAAKLEQAFAGLGAEVSVLANPARGELLGACAAMAARGHERLGFVWLGRGCFHKMQVAGIMRNSDCRTAGACKGYASDEPELVTHSDVIEAFRPEGADGEPVPLMLFFDSGLAAPEADARFAEGFSTSVSIGDVGDDFMLEPRYHDIALMTATGVREDVREEATSQLSSPFVMALANALGRPGISLFEASELVRDEINKITEEAQTPRLFASRGAERRALVAAVAL